MQKLIVNALCVLMLIPSLVCAMPVCLDTAPETRSSDNSHCADAGKNAAAETNSVMLLVDCTGIDLQQSPAPFSLSDPVFSPDLSDAVNLAMGPAPALGHFRFHPIRGSPGLPSSTQVQDPVYLTTERLRL